VPEDRSVQENGESGKKGRGALRREMYVRIAFIFLGRIALFGNVIEDGRYLARQRGSRHLVVGETRRGDAEHGAKPTEAAEGEPRGGGATRGGVRSRSRRPLTYLICFIRFVNCMYREPYVAQFRFDKYRFCTRTARRRKAAAAQIWPPKSGRARAHLLTHSLARSLA